MFPAYVHIGLSDQLGHVHSLPESMNHSDPSWFSFFTSASPFKLIARDIDLYKLESKFLFSCAATFSKNGLLPGLANTIDVQLIFSLVLNK